MPNAEFFIPQWDLPAGVGAVVSTRSGGCSSAPWDTNNLAFHVGDKPQHVALNRHALLASLPDVRAIQWLEQIHSADVARACSGSVTLTADAGFTQDKGLACAVMTADCLPVLFCDDAGTQVAAAHAGWRGLADGVLLNTLATFPDPAAVRVYLGPAIGPQAFEVGPEVARSFPWADSGHFRQGRGDRLFADLYGLARQQLNSAGVRDITGGNLCTYTQRELFYSYRRDGQTGRMASLIWLAR
ncbi:peptidoglycan editing factor PgeF [Thalassolituus marinus]|uniref:Purine nucleoside phosphorylase n=1 Tax=Thalassolituus marinus TaxID=671053 RepID=A0ABS7ZRN3_9GAMM|nr:peptidoglycan editing factor PgeF [Thalassolituus marinus]MCA6063180.1 peptidoglycan editing factor PgeF [Thalassolituus marinus]